MNLLFRLATLPTSIYWGALFSFILILGLGILVKLRLRPGSSWPQGALTKLKRDLNFFWFRPKKNKSSDPWNYSIYGGKPGLISSSIKSGPKPYLIELVFIGDGKNIHLKKRSNTLSFIHVYEGLNYEVSPGSLYEKEPGFFDKILWKLKGLDAQYLIIFWVGQVTPIVIPQGAVNPQVLARVRTSRILGRALREMFKGNILENRGRIFFFILFAAVAVIVARVMGYL